MYFFSEIQRQSDPLLERPSSCAHRTSCPLAQQRLLLPLNARLLLCGILLCGRQRLSCRQLLSRISAGPIVFHPLSADAPPFGAPTHRVCRLLSLERPNRRSQ